MSASINEPTLKKHLTQTLVGEHKHSSPLTLYHTQLLPTKQNYYICITYI